MQRIEKSKNPKRHVVLVGDGGCGKTCLMHSRVSDYFFEDYVPTIFDTRLLKTKLKQKTIDLYIQYIFHSLSDTAGQEEHDRLRVLCYKGADCVLICYDITNQDSFDNIAEKWISEAKCYAENAAIMVVGLKCDLENRKVLPDDARLLVLKWNLDGCLECSALTSENVNKVFNEATRLARIKRNIAGCPCILQ